MKKIISFIILFVLLFSSFSFWVNASYNYSNENILEKNNENISERWIKTFILKNGMKAMANILRSWYDIAEYWLKKIGIRWKDLKKVMWKRHNIADVLDRVADGFDHITERSQYIVYQQLVAGWIPRDIAWLAAELIFVVLL